MRCPLCEATETSFGLCQGCLEALTTRSPKPDDWFVGLVCDFDRLDEKGFADEMGRRFSRNFVRHYPALGRDLTREDLIRQVSETSRVADIRLRTTPLGYDEQGRLWCNSQTVFIPRDGRAAMVSRGVSASRPDGEKVGESWWWVDSRPPISASELTDQLRRFAALKEAGALSEAEFADKKADLLARI